MRAEQAVVAGLAGCGDRGVGRRVIDIGRQGTGDDRATETVDRVGRQDDGRAGRADRTGGDNRGDRAEQRIDQLRAIYAAGVQADDRLVGERIGRVEGNERVDRTGDRRAGPDDDIVPGAELDPIVGADICPALDDQASAGFDADIAGRADRPGDCRIEIAVEGRRHAKCVQAGNDIDGRIEDRSRWRGGRRSGQ